MYLVTLDPTMIENLETVLRKTALFASFTEDEIQALGPKVIKHLQRENCFSAKAIPARACKLSAAVRKVSICRCHC